jgi:type I restriction enzyme S subunit
MNAVIRLSPRAFVVWWRDVERWDPSSFHQVSWHWPGAVMKPLGSVLTARKEKIDRTKVSFSELQPITIHFDGSIDKRRVDGNREYTMELFAARPGDIVVAKIDLKNGAVAIVPDGWTNVAVTNHFAVYAPDRSRLVPEYLHLLIQTSFFKSHLWRNKVGAEGRKEVKLDFFEAEHIPLPHCPYSARSWRRMRQRGNTRPRWRPRSNAWSATSKSVSSPTSAFPSLSKRRCPRRSVCGGASWSDGR